MISIMSKNHRERDVTVSDTGRKIYRYKTIKIYICLRFHFSKSTNSPIAVEIGFFHGVTRKYFQGSMHRRTSGLVARFIGVKAKDCLQGPGVSSMTRWLSSTSVWWKSSLWCCKPALAPARPRRTRTHKCRTLGLISPSAHPPPPLLGAWTTAGFLAHRAATERTHTNAPGLCEALITLSWVWEGVSFLSN